MRHAWPTPRGRCGGAGGTGASGKGRPQHDLWLRGQAEGSPVPCCGRRADGPALGPRVLVQTQGALCRENPDNLGSMTRMQTASHKCPGYGREELEGTPRRLCQLREVGLATPGPPPPPGSPGCHSPAGSGTAC